MTATIFIILEGREVENLIFNPALERRPSLSVEGALIDQPKHAFQNTCRIDLPLRKGDKNESVRSDFCTDSLRRHVSLGSQPRHPVGYVRDDWVRGEGSGTGTE